MQHVLVDVSMLCLHEEEERMILFVSISEMRYSISAALNGTWA